MTCGSTDRARAPRNQTSITHWYLLSSIKHKLFVWWGLTDVARLRALVDQGNSRRRRLKTEEGSPTFSKTKTEKAGHPRKRQSGRCSITRKAVPPLHCLS